MHGHAKKILVTGADGFIGKNLCVTLSESNEFEIIRFLRKDSPDQLLGFVRDADWIIHLAGENRPNDESEFTKANIDLTLSIAEAIDERIKLDKNNLPIIFASSTQADQDNPYGRSKLAAEEIIKELSNRTGNPSFIYRLPGVFGKWCKPNYNSVVATFCHKMARGEPIQISDPEREIKLVYIDDVISSFIEKLQSSSPEGSFFNKIPQEYTVSLGNLAKQIKEFNNCKTTLISEKVGIGFTRPLYATYVSYLPSESFAYPLPKHEDERGVFVEMLKTHDSGQISYFTAHPGVTRGGHYHHTKTEKFLVIKGEALFRFRNLISNELFELKTSGLIPEVVDTIPGWSHDIKNTGNEDMIVMIWANENFNKDLPDTISYEV